MINHPIFNALPYQLQDCIGEMQRGTNLNEDYMLGSALFASSTAIGNAYKLHINGNWYQSANLFMVLVGKTGVSKSPALNTMLSPLYKNDKNSAKDYKRELMEFEELNKNDQSSLSHPKRKQLVLEDATMEAIYKVLDANPKGVGLFFDEIIGFFRNMSRYSGGGEQQQWLKFFDGNPVTVNRASSEGYFFDSPYIGLIGGIQPKVLPELYADNRDKNGFLERILFVYPDSPKRLGFPKNQSTQDAFDKYDYIIGRLLELDYDRDRNGDPISHILEFSTDALRVYSDFYAKSCNIVNQKDDGDPMLGFYPKMDSYCARFALILQLLYNACEEEGKSEIGERAVVGAIDICKYFLANAEKVVSPKGAQIDLSPLQKKHMACRMYDLQKYSYAEIGSIFGVTKQSICNWISEIKN